MFKRRFPSRFAVQSRISAIALSSVLILNASAGNGRSAVVDNASGIFGSLSGGSQMISARNISGGAFFVPSTTLVISQANGGGGGSFGTYTHDYVELKNVSMTPQSLNGLSLYYGSATGNFASSLPNAFALPNVILNPGQYHLVQLGTAGTGGVPVPSPDVVTTNITMSNASGKIALVNGAGLGTNVCGSTGNPCSAAQLAFVVDWVAYGAGGNGAAGVGEGGTSVNNGVAINSSQGAVRKAGGCADTDNNNLDFNVVTSPVPRNSVTTPTPCLPPAAVPDSYFTLQDTPLMVPAPGVLGNDVDPSILHTVTAVLVSGPGHAQSFALNANGSFSYDPNAGFIGTDSFTYKARDNFNTDSDTVTVTINVLYRFAWFSYSGLLSNGQALDQVMAGSDVPIRFTLDGDQGNPYSQSPTSQQINCATNAPIGAATVINRHLPDPFYSSLYDFYQTTWRTQTSWKFTCRRLTLHLNDGTTRSLNFYFK